MIEYQWQEVSDSADTAYYNIVDNNKKAVSAYFNNVQPQEIPETDDKAAKSIWENELVYVQQLLMPGLLRIRALISCK